MNLTFIEKFRNRISGPVGHRLISSRSDDVYIAAYPRSGSTWLRTILVNIMEPSAMSDPDVFNALIPAVSIRNAAIVNRLESPRTIMTHSLWRTSMAKALYLVRDGRDAFYSSYHYQVTRRGLSMTIEEYYRRYHDQVYGPTWAQHTESWMGEALTHLGDKLLMVRFEDLRGDTAKVVDDVCAFIGLRSEPDVLAQAIENASLDKVRQIETLRDGEIKQSNASFYREGTSKQWQDHAYHGVIELFEADSAEAMEIAGYGDL